MLLKNIIIQFVVIFLRLYFKHKKQKGILTAAVIFLFYITATLAHAKIKRTAGFALQKKANKELK